MRAPGPASARRIGAGTGWGRLGGLPLADNRTGACETCHASALFVMIGGEPLTGWLDGVVQRDSSGYILTGTTCSATTVPLGRSPSDQLQAPDLQEQ